MGADPLQEGEGKGFRGNPSRVHRAPWLQSLMAETSTRVWALERSRETEWEGAEQEKSWWGRQGLEHESLVSSRFDFFFFNSKSNVKLLEGFEQEWKERSIVYFEKDHSYDMKKMDQN